MLEENDYSTRRNFMLLNRVRCEAKEITHTYFDRNL